MAWVVKRWRTEGLERLLSEEARASAETARAAAERDARRARRAADRAAADAAAELVAGRLRCRVLRWAGVAPRLA